MRMVVLVTWNLGANFALQASSRCGLFSLGHIAPVVRQAADGARELSLLSWGFMLLQSGRAPSA